MASPLYNKYLFYDSSMASYWDNQTLLSGSTRVSKDPGEIHGSIMTVLFSRTEATGVREDYAMFSLHLGGTLGTNTWGHLDDGLSATVEGLFDTAWTTIKAKVFSHIVLAGYQWRDYGADFPLGKTGLSKPGPVRRLTTRSVAGTGANGPLPDQVAETVTFKTASRKHWGRIYLPPLDYINQTVNARMTTAVVDTVSGAIHTFVNACNANATQIDTFVWSPKYRGQFSVTSIQMDDTFDVIRSRRAKQTTYRKEYTS